MYYCTCASDQQTAPTTVWSEAASVATQTDQYAHWTADPRDFPDFKKFWKIDKKKKFVIYPGGTLDITIHYDVNYLTVGTKQATVEIHLYKAWLTKYVFFTFHGPPLNQADPDANDADDLRLGMSGAQLNLIEALKVKFKYVTGASNPSYNVLGDLATDLPAGGLAIRNDEGEDDKAEYWATGLDEEDP